MTILSTSFLVKCGAVVACVSILAGCAPSSPSTGSSQSAPSASETPIALDGGGDRLVADESASPELQGFLDAWNKDGVTIAETPATDDEQLVAFTDENENGVPDEGEPVLAQAEGSVADIPQLAVSQSSSGVVTGSCGSNSYIVRPGNYDYRGKTFAVGFNGMAYHGGFGDTCTLSLSLSSTPFPDEEWTGLILGTKSGKEFGEYSVFYGSSTVVQIDIPFPTSLEMLDDVYGRDGELSIFSHPINDDYRLPEDRMIIGSWKSEVTFSN